MLKDDRISQRRWEYGMWHLIGLVMNSAICEDETSHMHGAIFSCFSGFIAVFGGETPKTAWINNGPGSSGFYFVEIRSINLSIYAMLLFLGKRLFTFCQAIISSIKQIAISSSGQRHRRVSNVLDSLYYRTCRLIKSLEPESSSFHSYQ